MQNNEMSALWHVLQLKPRTEKKMAEYCASLQIEHYLPLRAERKIYQRRRVEVSKPVFPGYIFASFEPSRRALVLQGGWIVRMLKPVDQAKLLHELDQVRRALEENPVLGACPGLKHGERVRIVSGPFRGLEGIISTFRNRSCVILNVDIIGKGIPVEVAGETLERI